MDIKHFCQLIVGIGFCVLVMIFLSASFCQSEFVEESSHNSTWNVCVGAKLCSDCIARHSSCAWCADTRTYHKSNFTRCDTYENLRSRGTCGDISYPENELVVIENASLSDAERDTHHHFYHHHAVQVTPQKIKLKLRVGQSKTLRVSVRQAMDYPLDVYYLMDVSKSLSDDLLSLRSLAGALVRKLRRLTSDLRMGFGTFVDKTALPFINVDQDTCQGTSCCPDCVKPFSYRNEQPLTNHTRSFWKKVYYTKVSTNLDTVEGGFDALLQAAVCKNEIGWRDRARRMLVFVTDAGFHFAGDGKLAGIVQPNDGECHMNRSYKDYNDSMMQDYPSIGQLNEVLQRNNIVPVFAVPDGRLTLLYRELSALILGAKIGIMAANSNNVVQLIERQFQVITSEVELVDNAEENLAVSYTSHCADGRTEPASSKCTDLPLGKTVHFDVKFTARTCYPGGNLKKSQVNISPVGFDEKVAVQVEVICSCQCDRDKIRHVRHCTRGNGTFACGQCNCDPGRYGEECQCSGSADMDPYDTSTCIAHNSTVPCHGRGNCVCGECECNKRLHPRESISGKYCECDNFSCDRYQGKLCGGLDRGECYCDEINGKSKCRCRPGYSGKACECHESTKHCRTPSGLICNGFGECKCGKCHCNRSSQYFGPTCEQCPTCHIGLCSSYRECVLCTVFDSGMLTTEQCSMCTINIQTIENIKNETDISLCQYRLDSNCTIHYGYGTTLGGASIVYVQHRPVCREIVQIEPAHHHGLDSKWIIMCIVMLILITGIVIIMVVRLFMYCQDSYEYAQFAKEAEMTEWKSGYNPLYRSSICTYVNPVHGLDDVNQNLLLKL